MSYWTQPKPVQRERAVAIEQISEAALALLNEGGNAALTMRAVAASVGVTAPSLYSRVRSVDDLADLALDRALGADPTLRALCESTDSAPEQVLHALFQHLRHHPWACRIIAERTPRGPHYLRLSERLIVGLKRAGVEEPLAASYALSNFVIGSALTAGVAEHEASTSVDPEAAPSYALAHAAGGDPIRGPETVFARGLAVLLDGFRA